MTDPPTTEQIAALVERCRRGSDRLYGADFLKRMWLLDYAAAVELLTDFVERAYIDGVRAAGGRGGEG